MCVLRMLVCSERVHVLRGGGEKCGPTHGARIKVPVCVCVGGCAWQCCQEVVSWMEGWEANCPGGVLWHAFFGQSQTLRARAHAPPAGAAGLGLSLLKNRGAVLVVEAAAVGAPPWGAWACGRAREKRERCAYGWGFHFARDGAKKSKCIDQGCCVGVWGDETLNKGKEHVFVACCHIKALRGVVAPGVAALTGHDEGGVVQVEGVRLLVGCCFFLKRARGGGGVGDGASACTPERGASPSSHTRAHARGG